MDHIVGIAFSPITLAISLDYCREFDFNYSPIIFRNFSCSHHPQLRLSDDRDISPNRMLTIAKYVDQFLLEINYPETLLIPHSLNPIYRLIVAHTKIKNVYYIEEGDLSYNAKFHITSIEKNFQSSNFYKNRDFEKHNFDLMAFDLFPRTTDQFFEFLGEKYCGTISYSSDAFQDFPGENLKLNIKNINQFHFPHIVLICVADPRDILLLDKPTGYLHSRFTDQISLQIIKNIISNIINIILNGHRQEENIQFLLKPHPAMNDSEFLNHYSNHKIITWEKFISINNAIENIELGFINFKYCYSIGESSIIRYANMANPQMPTWTLSCQRILSLAIELTNGIPPNQQTTNDVKSEMEKCKYKCNE